MPEVGCIFTSHRCSWMDARCSCGCHVNCMHAGRESCKRRARGWMPDALVNFDITWWSKYVSNVRNLEEHFPSSSDAFPFSSRFGMNCSLPKKWVRFKLHKQHFQDISFDSTEPSKIKNCSCVANNNMNHISYVNGQKTVFMDQQNCILKQNKNGAFIHLDPWAGIWDSASFFNYQYDPQSLCQLAQTCRNLRVKCRSDEIWEPLFYDRWGKIIGPTAFTAWEQIVKGENARILNRSYMPSCLWMLPLTCIWSFSRHNDKSVLEELNERFLEYVFRLGKWQIMVSRAGCQSGGEN